MEVAAGHDHISEMNLDELIEAGAQAGLVSDGVELMSVFSGSAWFDRKPVVLASVLWWKASTIACSARVGPTGCAFASVARRERSPRSVRVASVFDAKHNHFSGCVVDAVEDSIRTSARRPDACKVEPQRLADPLRILDERSGDELHGCARDGFRQLFTQRSSRGRGEDELVRRVVHERRSARTAPTPLTTSPAP